MTEQELYTIWNYYLMLEEDLCNTSRYVEPRGQENTYSFEFAKLLILSCVEIEAVYNMIYYIDNNSYPENIGVFKEYVLTKYPKIVETGVYVSRLEEWIKPFEEWGENCRLEWWDSYGHIKHSLRRHLGEATYLNTCKSFSALYILILYLSRICKIKIPSYQSTYIKSEYSDKFLDAGAGKPLPDFM